MLVRPFMIRDITTTTTDSSGQVVKLHDQRPYRAVYTVVSMFCMLILAFLFGSRAKRLHLFKLSSMNPVRTIVISLYVFGMCFILSAAIIQSGLGLTTQQDCYSAIIICLVFYVGSKVMTYVFLVERAHCIRAPYKRRHRDKVWLVGMCVVLGGFGAIAVTAFLWPVAQMSADGICRIGLPFKVTAPLLTYDIVINIALTALFVRLLKPLLTFSRNGQKGKTSLFVNPKTLVGDARAVERQERTSKTLRKLVFKTIVGGTAVMIPTVANLGILFFMKGHEQGWLCLTICSLDITWAVINIHWLTIDDNEMDDPLMTTAHSGPHGAGIPLNHPYAGSRHSHNAQVQGGRVPSVPRSDSNESDKAHVPGSNLHHNIVKTTSVTQHSVQHSDSDVEELIGSSGKSDFVIGA